MERHGCLRYIVMFFLVLCVWRTTAFKNISDYETGGCFARINWRNKCEGFLYKNISVAQCCSRGGAYYSKRNMTYTEIFRHSINNNSGGLDDCKPCRVWENSLKPVTCKNKKCAFGKVCKKIKNKVQCVCPQMSCSNKSHIVCSNSNITYQSECHMKRWACNNSQEEWVMYNGSCQASCNMVRCNDNKQCIQDQFNHLYCVNCNKPCDEPIFTLCGLNNVTYNSQCELRKATCKLGKTIGIAYAGKCREVANCNTIKCTPGQQCIMNVKKPLCIDCGTGCKSTANKPIHYYGKKVCGSNDKTFKDLCDLKMYICSKHVAVDVVNYGKCQLGRKFPSLSVQKFKALQGKELTVQQLLQVGNKIGIPLTLKKKRVRKNILMQKVNIYRLLRHIYKTVTKSKI